MTAIHGPAIKPANFSHSPNFPALLAQLRSSLLVTTYQAGQLCSFGTHEGKLHVGLEPFSVAMGVALHPRKVAVGSRGIIWFLESAGRELAQQRPPAGTYDAALLTRSAHVTGNIHTHEMAFGRSPESRVEGREPDNSRELRVESREPECERSTLNPRLLTRRLSTLDPQLSTRCGSPTRCSLAWPRSSRALASCRGGNRSSSATAMCPATAAI